MKAEEVKLRSLCLALVLMIALSIVPSVSLAQTVEQNAETSVSIENWVLRLKLSIERCHLLTPDEKNALLLQLETALRLAKENDINGAIQTIVNVTRQLTLTLNERNRERIRATLEERVRVLRQLGDIMPTETEQLLNVANRSIESIRVGKVDVEEINKAMKKMAIAIREAKRAKEKTINTILNITENEEVKKALKDYMPHFSPKGIIALLEPAEYLIKNAERQINLMGRGTELLQVTEALKRSIQYLRLAVEKFAEGDFTAFQEYLGQSKGALQEAKEAMAKLEPLPRNYMALMGAYMMVKTATRMVEMSVETVDRVLGGILSENRAFVKGVVLEYNETSRELLVLGSLHLVIESPEGKLRSAGFVPLVGKWVIKITDDTDVTGKLEESAYVVAIGRALPEDGKVVVIADAIYANVIQKLEELGTQIAD